MTAWGHTVGDVVGDGRTGRATWHEQIAGGAASLALVAVAGAIGAVLQHGYGIASPVLLLFLLAVFLSATRYGLAASLLAGLTSAAAFDFFFTPPLFSFAMGQPEDVVALLAFCVVAVIANERASRLREQTLAAERRAAFVAALYRLGATLAGCPTRPAAIAAVLAELAATLQAEAGFLPADATAATPTPPSECRLPSAEAAGVIRLHRPGGRFSDADRSLAGAMVGLLDLSLARVDLRERVEQARIAAANQALTTTLLDSISHDLRAPLAAILAASQTLGDGAAVDSVRTIRAEAERLDRLAANLLDMLRLDGGHLAPRLRTEDAADVLHAVAARSAPLLGRHRLRLAVPADLPWVRLDHALFEPVLTNLLDNAAKFAPPGSVIELAARAGAAGSIDISVRDEGPGLPPEALDRVFDKFVRLPPAGGAARGGVGLGLAICRGFVAAMGGSIAAANRTDRSGTVFTITLPAEAVPALPELSVP
jgi:two-component system sensor histidine kinase KdpD